MARWILPQKRLAIYLRDDFKCLWCGRCLKNAEPEELNLDHLECRSNNGSNEASNLATTCQTCNKRRGISSMAAFAARMVVTAGLSSDPAIVQMLALDKVSVICSQAAKPLNINLAKAIIKGE